ncbi:hypothetical protein ZWY2020_032712 [Hordeum vulgare]|nr:hypothetical protein ZWY2020_032712 [Hordeum vulgare]
MYSHVQPMETDMLMKKIAALQQQRQSSNQQQLLQQSLLSTRESPTNQIADMDRLVEDDSLGDNVDSFLSHNDAAGPSDGHSRCMASSKGFTFREISSARASTNKVVCCHFSSDGKLLATGGHDKKVVLWHAETLKQKAVLEVWDVDNQDDTVHTFTGHSASVMSVDFHPNKDDFICSCDGNGSKPAEISASWWISAAASENVVSILDVETQACVRIFEGHTGHVDSLCWSPTGDYVVSTSEDTVKVCFKCLVSNAAVSGAVGHGGEKEHDGCGDGLISLGLLKLRLVASASHDKHVKLWK